MNIIGQKVVLTAIEETDLPLLHQWANDPEIGALLDGWHFPTSRKDQQEWFESLNCQSLHQKFAVRAPELGLIGTANLVNIDWKNKNAFHGMMLGAVDIRGKGYGTDTIMACMRYAFEELGLERLDGSVIEYNETSLHTYTQKCGWQLEGRKQNAYWRNNRLWDKLILGITRQNYGDLIAKTSYWH